ncbi:MAG: domain S-box protein [Candidatus Sulfotelmatobacter sp.]|nr:domain S-box protein [Candidatus Sulfotelmatobacter sp.]
MNTAAQFPWPGLSPSENATTSFRAVFEHAPFAAARCTAQGVIVETNTAFEQAVDLNLASRRSLRFCEMVPSEDREATSLLLQELFDCSRDCIRIKARTLGREAGGNWIAWRQPGGGAEPDHALLIAEQLRDTAAEEPLLQAQRWEAVGRLAGGVVHDFNNVLTGVMLYCDLLLSSMDSRDRRRRYADEIRSAIIQASALVRQLLVFARPQSAPTRPLLLNEVATAMRDLLTRLAGENIELDLHLDPELGLVKIDQAQAQQILLNLVLNARDALPKGGRITVETSNCNFQPLTGSMSHMPSSVFPCVLLVVGDNGCGMNAETQQRLFEPFFTTKDDGKGTGLGLTTVRTIVTTNRGLIQFESEPGHGTRVMILFPRAPQADDSDFLATAIALSESPAPQHFQEIKKESLL